MKPVIIIAIAFVVAGIFWLLVTETIDLRPDSTSVRQYTDLKQRQNEWIAENCVNEKCNDRQSVTEKIEEFIEVNRNYFDSNGFNMYGFDENGFNKQGITESQSKIVREAYIKCTSGTNQVDKCDSTSGDLCMSSTSSRNYEMCNQQSRMMNEQFRQENNP